MLHTTDDGVHLVGRFLAGLAAVIVILIVTGALECLDATLATGGR